MSRDRVLSVDQGTTGTTVLVTTPTGEVLGRGYREHPQHFPQPGWVEHDAEAIWRNALDAGADALREAGASAGDIAAVGITNQRETLVAWDASTGRAIGPVIVWQDRRTADRCAELDAEGWRERVRALAGLPIDPYFSGTKAEWLLANDEDVAGAARAGRLRLGTIDSWLVHRMSGGSAHVTDASNASRTMLYDIHAGRWSDELCGMLGVDPAWLPQVVASSGEVARCDPASFLGLDAPVAGIAGDQQAALFGQACVERGQAKATYGTGAFVLVNTDDEAPVTNALLSTVAWARPVGGAGPEGSATRLTYALEGAIFTAGASVQWLRDELGFVGTAPEVEQLARSVPDSGGVVLVPAFAGLGAPHWDPNARGALLGMTRGTSRGHVARATLEAVALRVREVVDAMRDEGTPVTELRVDGGMAANDLLLQLQADLLGVAVQRPANIETTGTGAALLAALGSGLLADMDEVAAAWRADRTFEPGPGAAEAGAMVERFEAAVAATRAFARTRPAAAGATTSG